MRTNLQLLAFLFSSMLFSLPATAQVPFVYYVSDDSEFTTLGTEHEMVIYDGSPWKRKSGSVTADGATRIAGSGTDVYYERQFTGPVNAKWFGAKPNDSLSDQNKIQDALNSSYNSILIEGGIFEVNEITVPAGKTLIIEANTTVLDKQLNTSALGATVKLSAGSSLVGGGQINANNSGLNPSRGSTAFANYGILVVGDNVTISDIFLINALSAFIAAFERKNISIRNHMDSGSARGPMFVRCQDVTVINATIRDTDMNYSGVYQHCIDFIYCDNVRLNGLKVINVNSGSNAPSGTISGLSVFGNRNSIFENLLFNGFLSTVNDGLPIADDGSYNSVLSNVVITGWKYGVGLEVQGSQYCTYSNILIDGTVLSNTTSGSVGLHILDTAIEGGLLNTNTGDIQSRDRALANNNKFHNITVIGGFAGFRIAGAKNNFTNCQATGNTYGWRFQQLQGGTLTSYWRSDILQRINDNTITDCEANHCQFGFVFWGGQDHRLIRPKAINCQYGFMNQTRLQSTVSSAVNNSITLLTTQTANLWKGYMVYITNGPGVGQIRRIVSHNTTTYTLDANWTTNPDGDSEAVIVDNPQGKIYLELPSAIDNQNFTLSGAASFPLTDTDPSHLKEIIITSGGERISYNQKLRLKNVITGASSPDLIIQVTGIDATTRDRFFVTPLTLGNGSAVTGTLAPTLTNGTGTLTTSNFNANIGSLGKIVGSGTNLPNEIDGHYWLKIAGEWRLVLKGASDTEYWLTSAVTTPSSGQSFQIIKIDVEGIPWQVNGISFNRYYGDVVLSGDVSIVGSSGPSLNTFRSRSANFIELTPNSTTPSVAEGNLFKTNNSTSTTISGFSGATAGKRITVTIADNNTFLNFSSGTLKGYSGSAYDVDPGFMLIATYDGNNWFCEIIK